MIIIEGNLKSENEILKRLLRDSHIFINYDSTDCDGCSTSKVLKFNNLESIYRSINESAEWNDGPFNYSLPIVLENGKLDLNEDFNGGQWSN